MIAVALAAGLFLADGQGGSGTFDNPTVVKVTDSSPTTLSPAGHLRTITTDTPLEVVFSGDGLQYPAITAHVMPGSTTTSFQVELGIDEPSTDGGQAAEHWYRAVYDPQGTGVPANRSWRPRSPESSAPVLESQPAPAAAQPSTGSDAPSTSGPTAGAAPEQARAAEAQPVPPASSFVPALVIGGVVLAAGLASAFLSRLRRKHSTATATPTSKGSPDA